MTFQEPVRIAFSEKEQVDRTSAKPQNQTEEPWNPWWKRRKDRKETAKQMKKGQHRGHTGKGGGKSYRKGKQ